MTIKFIRAAELSELLGISSTTLWRWRQQKIIPQPLALGKRIVGWQEEVIQEWLLDLKDSHLKIRERDSHIVLDVPTCGRRGFIVGTEIVKDIDLRKGGKNE